MPRRMGRGSEARVRTNKRFHFDHAIDPQRLNTYVRIYLRLPAQANEETVRATLLAHGDNLPEWYETRLRAIEESIATRQP